jgi:hypothetical protein
VQRTHFIVREGTAHARCDAGGTRIVLHRGMDSLVMEQGVVRLRHAREKVCVGVDARVEKERRARRALSATWAWLCTRRQEPPGAWAEDRRCQVKCAEDACAEDGGS